MKTPSVEISETRDIKAGALFYLSRGDYKVALCISAHTNADDLEERRRIVPLCNPSNPTNELVAIYENCFNGVGAVIDDARVVVDLSSLIESCTHSFGYDLGPVYAAPGGLFIALSSGRGPSGFLNLETGMIRQERLGSPWAAFSRWQIEVGPHPAEVIYKVGTESEAAG